MKLRDNTGWLYCQFVPPFETERLYNDKTQWRYNVLNNKAIIISGGSRISHRGHGPVRGSVDLRRGHFLVKMYVKTKELGPVGGACANDYARTLIWRITSIGKTTNILTHDEYSGEHAASAGSEEETSDGIELIQWDEDLNYTYKKLHRQSCQYRLLTSKSTTHEKLYIQLKKRYQS